MLGDVRDPEFVHGEAMELPIHEVIGCGNAFEARDGGGPGESFDSSSSHQDRDQPARAGDIHADGELSMNAAVAVGAARGHADLADHAHQPAAAELGGAGGTLPVPVVVALIGNAQQAATGIHGGSGVDEPVDHRVRPFGSTPPSSSSHRPGGGSRSPARAAEHGRAPRGARRILDCFVPAGGRGRRRPDAANCGG